MFNRNSIAIIGMAGRFPDAACIDELYQNLASGKESVRAISEKRLNETALPKDLKYKNCGYLNDIDKFDYKLFNLSYAEAVNMSPSHRMLLEVVYEIFENAGYNPDVFNGVNVSVYASDSVANDYGYHAEEISPTLVTGNSAEFLTTKVSRYFNLMGNSVVVNTACSSALVALNAACNELLLGDAEYALVCGVNVNVLPVSTFGYDMGLSSPDGKSRAFSSQASGMSFGETVCGILLKRYDRALEDGDNIQSVIRGYAVNNNGSKSTSILAPHSSRQAEVIRKAWKKAKIDPLSIGYIEAHGSGTELGDSLEIEGLTLAYKGLTDSRQFVPISTLKSNIGHCMLAAGLAGIIKAVLALKHKVLFPNIYCEQLNPIINFKDSPVYVNTELKKWESDSIRFAGVTSLGRGGVNGHVVLQECEVKQGFNSNNSEQYLITVSGNSLYSLQENKKRLLDCLENTPHLQLSDISFTLNNGRRHHKFRYATWSTGIEELKSNLEHSIKQDLHVEPVGSFDKIFFLMADEAISEHELKHCSELYPELSQQIKLLNLESEKMDSYTRTLAFQVGMYHVLKRFSVNSDHFLSTGLGKLSKDIVLGKVRTENAISQMAHYQSSPKEELITKMNLFLESESSASILILHFGKSNELTNALESNNAKKVVVLSLTNLADENLDSVKYLLEKMYLSGADGFMKSYFSSHPGKRIELPAYAFEKTRCWLRDEPRKKEQKKTDVTVPIYGSLKEAGNEFEKLVARTFGEVLELERISLADDFFELGGDSIKASKAINRLKDLYIGEINFEDIFDFSSVSGLAAYLAKQISVETAIRDIWRKTLAVNDINLDDDFFELGGHSLLANQVIIQIRKVFQVQINFDEFFERSALAGLIELVREKKQTGTRELEQEVFIPAIIKQTYYSVSYAQQRILLAEQFYKTGTAYNTPNIFWVEGDLNVENLKGAFQSLVERHEPLRTSFHFIDGKPVQKISDSENLTLHCEDWSDKYVTTGDDAIAEEAIQKLVKPFNLSEAPLMRVSLIKVDRQKWLLLTDMSHIISDRTTKGILVHEFIQLYQGLQLSPLRIQYKDFTTWQSERIKLPEYKAMEDFWLRTYAKEVPELIIPTDNPRKDVLDHSGDVYDFPIGGELAEQIRKLAAQHEGTIYIVVLTVLNVFLHKLTKAEDVVIGAPFAQRNHSELENMVGILLNTVTFRNYPKAEVTFSDFLKQVKTNSLEVYKNSDYQFEMLLEKLQYKRKPGRNPLFDVLLNSQTAGSFNNDVVNKNSAHTESGALRFTPHAYKDNSTGFDLSFDVNEYKKFIHFRVYFRTALFKKSTIEYLMKEFVELFAQVVKSPNSALESFNLFQSKEPKSLTTKMKIKNKLKHHDIY